MNILEDLWHLQVRPQLLASLVIEGHVEEEDCEALERVEQGENYSHPGEALGGQGGQSTLAGLPGSCRGSR